MTLIYHTGINEQISHYYENKDNIFQMERVSMM